MQNLRALLYLLVIAAVGRWLPSNNCKECGLEDGACCCPEGHYRNRPNVVPL